MKSDEETGYRRPPKHSRWKKGQSGNPKGRPRRRPDFLKEAAAILTRPVAATTATGKSVKLDAFEAAFLALCKKGLQGHKTSLLEAIRIMLEVAEISEKTRTDPAASRARLVELLEKHHIPVPDSLLKPL